MVLCGRHDLATHQLIREGVEMDDDHKRSVAAVPIGETKQDASTEKIGQVKAAIEALRFGSVPTFLPVATVTNEHADLMIELCQLFQDNPVIRPEHWLNGPHAGLAPSEDDEQVPETPIFRIREGHLIGLRKVVELLKHDIEIAKRPVHATCV